MRQRSIPEAGKVASIASLPPFPGWGAIAWSKTLSAEGKLA